MVDFEVDFEAAFEVDFEVRRCAGLEPDFEPDLELDLELDFELEAFFLVAGRVWATTIAVVVSAAAKMNTVIGRKKLVYQRNTGSVQSWL